MKIALVSQEYPPETARGGIGTQTYAKAKGLSELGHEIFVLCRKDTSGTSVKVGNLTEIRVPGYHDYFYSADDINEWKNHSMVINAEINNLHKQVGLDIVDFPEWAAEGYSYLTTRNEDNWIPSVIQLHGPLVMLGHTIGWPDMESEFFKVGTMMEATCVQLADAVYSSSECSAQWIRKYYDFPEKEIPVIHVGVDTKMFSPRDLPKYDRPTVLFAGKIVPNKGVEELVEACSRLIIKFPDLELILIGNGNEKYIQSLTEKAKRAGAKNLLRFPGFKEKALLPDELSRAHVFAAPSYYEGGPGFVYLEAMACGLPVIAASGSGVDEIVVDGKNGMLVPPKNVEALSVKLESLLANSEQTLQMGRNAREFVLENADNQKLLRKLEAFYLSVLKKQNVLSR